VTFREGGVEGTVDLERTRQTRGVLVAAAFSSLAMVGVFHTLLGAALPAIRTSFGIDVVRSGMLGSAAWLGFTLVVLAGGALSDFFGRRRILILASSVMGICSVLLGTIRAFWVNSLLFAVIGGGTGMIVSTSSALVMELFPGREGMMNVHHFFYALGAIAGPLAMGAVLAKGGQWETIYRAAGILMLILGGAFLFMKMREDKHPLQRDMGPLWRILRERKLLILVLITLFGMGTQNGVSYWLVSFLRDIRELSIFLAGLGLSLFSIGMAMGRLLSAWLASRHGNTRVLVILFITLHLGLFLLLHVAAEAGILFICFILGMGCSGLFPGILALGGLHFPRWAGTTMGLLGTAAGMGGTLMPWIMSVASKRTSLTTGFYTAQLAGLVAFGFLLVFSKRLSGSERKGMERGHD
jgi:MFS family permease